MDQRRDRAGTAAEGVGDVGVGQAAVEAEDERGALAVGERGEGVGQLAARRARPARSVGGRGGGTGAARGGASGTR